MGASVLFFIATALMGVFDSTEWVTVFFWVNLAIGTTLSAFTAIVQNMGMAMAGALGDKYVQGTIHAQFFIILTVFKLDLININYPGYDLFAYPVSESSKGLKEAAQLDIIP